MISIFGCIGLMSKSANSERGDGKFALALVSHLRGGLGERRGTGESVCQPGERVPARRALALLDSNPSQECRASQSCQHGLLSQEG